MKNFLLFCLFLFTISTGITDAQVPQGFNYQAIARDGSGVAIVNENMLVRISLQSNPVVGRPLILWQEEHEVTTNQFGLMSFVIGEGDRLSGLYSSFSEIDWLLYSVYIKTTIQYPGSSWTEMGISQLWSVPYSMVSGNLGGSINKLSVVGVTEDMGEALFEVKNSFGQTIFAVFNEGVRIYVSDGDSKGAKGGFAIGGFGMGKGVDEYLRVTRDSTRVYINDTDEKARKGGFAIGGFGSSKEANYNFLMVDEEKLKGGKVDYLNITSLNTFIGEEAGINTVPDVVAGDGVYNSFIGYNSGLLNTSGRNNVFIGNESGSSNTQGFNNIFIGNEAGKNASATTNSTFIGEGAGFNVTGDDNIAIGDNAGTNAHVTTHELMGVTILGIDAGRNTSGELNTFIGYGSGSSWINPGSGNRNTYLGAGAGGGYANILGSGNVCIGFDAGYRQSGDNKLFIENSEADEDNSLIYGEFDNDKLKLNASVTIRDALSLTPRSTAPPSPSAGDMYFNSVSKKLMVYDGSNWKACW